MTNWPIAKDGGLWTSAGLVLSGGTVVTASASTHTKGTYAQITASTPHDAGGLLLSFQNENQNDYLMDVAIGAAASEVVIVPDLMISARTAGDYIFIPIFVPAGTRLSARCQGGAASVVIEITVNIFSPGYRTDGSFARMKAYGVSTADSGGVSVDPGGTINTKGAWTEIVASTSTPIRNLIIALGNQANIVRTSMDMNLDVGIGGSGAEVAILSDLVITQEATADHLYPRLIGPLPMDIPAGTRLSVRAASSNADVADRLFDVTLYGLD